MRSDETAGGAVVRYCPDCGGAHGNTTAACPRASSTNTAGEITRTVPLTGYGIRKCRGHWHVAHFENGVGSVFDLAIEGDPFNSAEAALAELADVAFSEWRDHIDIKMRNGEVINTRMDLSSKVRANELILKAWGRLDPNSSQVNNGVVINIITPGIAEEDLA